MGCLLTVISLATRHHIYGWKMLYAECTEITSWWWTFICSKHFEDKLSEINWWERVCFLLVLLTCIYHVARVRECKVQVTCCRSTYIIYIYIYIYIYVCVCVCVCVCVLIHTLTHTHTHSKFKISRCSFFSSLPIHIIHLQAVYYSWLHSMWAINIFWWSDVGRILQQFHALCCCTAPRTCSFKVRDWLMCRK
jgi:hypothetical protein